MAFKAIQRFMRYEASAGLLVIFCALLAIAIKNSSFSFHYDHLLQTTFSLSVGALSLKKTLLHWVNDGFMTIFFLLVGLEMKREMMVGELNTLKKISLPAFAAFGGMALPALLFFLYNWNDPMALKGWAIPTATDIAFALAILTLLAKSLPSSIRVLLTAIAIFDDLGAIIIIAIFYTKNLSHTMLSIALGLTGLLFLLNRLKVESIVSYLLVGFCLWVCVLKSGVHATLAGVVTAFALPSRTVHIDAQSPLRKLEVAIHPWVAYLILPLFAFANAGVEVSGNFLSQLTHPVAVGIWLGLLLGKQLGVFSAAWLSEKLKLSHLPNDMHWGHVYGMSILCGIGFTMSLFIGMLAYGHSAEYMHAVRIGVLFASLISAVLGYMVLKKCG